jgi:hypothetical protein
MRCTVCSNALIQYDACRFSRDFTIDFRDRRWIWNSIRQFKTRSHTCRGGRFSEVYNCARNQILWFWQSVRECLPGPILIETFSRRCIRSKCTIQTNRIRFCASGTILKAENRFRWSLDHHSYSMPASRYESKAWLFFYIFCRCHASTV